MLDGLGNHGNQMFEMTTCIALTIFLCVLVTGCMTAAQRQFALMQKNWELAQPKLEDCLQKVENNTAYKSIDGRIPRRNLSPTLTQLADSQVPTEEDAEMLIVRHNEVAVCRELAIQEMMKILPGFVPMIVEQYHNADFVMVDLVQRKITWGEANKRRVKWLDEFRAKFQAAQNQVVRELTESHNAELAQRQAALNALSQWADRQTALMQNQQMINMLNRPVITTCTGSGYYVNCFSR